MKISAQQYARSLFEMTLNKSKEEVIKIIDKFVVFLYKRQCLNSSEAIIAEFKNLHEQESGQIEAELVSARPLNESAKEKIKLYLENKLGATQVRLKEKIDGQLIGGFILRYNGLVFDGSIKNNLLKFKKQISN